MEVITLSLCRLLKLPTLVACFLWAVSSSLSISMDKDGEFLPFSDHPSHIPNPPLLLLLKPFAFSLGFFILPLITFKGFFPPTLVALILLISSLRNTKRNILSIFTFGALALLSISFSPSAFLNAISFSTLASLVNVDKSLNSDEELELNPFILFAFLPFISLIGGFPLILKVNTTYKIIFNFCLEGFFLAHFFSSPNSRTAITTFLLSHPNLNPSLVFLVVLAGFCIGAALSPFIHVNLSDWKYYPLFVLAATSSLPGGLFASASALPLLLLPKLGIPSRGLPMIYSFPYFS